MHRQPRSFITAGAIMSFQFAQLTHLLTVGGNGGTLRENLTQTEGEQLHRKRCEAGDGAEPLSRQSNPSRTDNCKPVCYCTSKATSAQSQSNPTVSLALLGNAIKGHIRWTESHVTL